MKLAVLLLPGDGIGPEVVRQAEKVLRRLATLYGFALELAHEPIGGAALELGLPPLPERTREKAEKSDAVLLGAVGGPKWDGNPPSLRPEQGLLALRRALGVFANLRPIRLYPSLAHRSPIREELVGQGVDLLIVRELIGGLYFGEPKRLEADAAIDTMTYTRAEIERLAHVAFRAARQRRGKLTSVDKSNVLMCSRLWRQVFTEVGQAYPDVALEHMLVDTAAMELVRHPERFDVLATENTFGDILSDEAAALVGSIGVLPSASLGASGRPGLYEPIHGSAPDIAGRDLANPVGAILSVALLFRHQLGAVEVAASVEQAVEETIASGIVTKDLGTDGVGTEAFGDEVVRRLRRA